MYRGFAVQSRIYTPELITSDATTELQCGQFLDISRDDLQNWMCPVQVR